MTRSRPRSMPLRRVMRQSDLARYGLWCGIVVTAEGNRREYHMATTWLPHLATNTLSLLLPDIYRLMIRRKRGSSTRAPDRPQSLPREVRDLIGATLTTMLCDRPGYVLYVTPLAFGVDALPWCLRQPNRAASNGAIGNCACARHARLGAGRAPDLPIRAGQARQPRTYQHAVECRRRGVRLRGQRDRLAAGDRMARCARITAMILTLRCIPVAFMNVLLV